MQSLRLLLVIHAFVPSLQTYGANVDQIKAEIGAVVSQTDIEEALKAKKYKVLTFTHVDTSTGALSPYRHPLRLILYSPKAFYLMQKRSLRPSSEFPRIRW